MTQSTDFPHTPLPPASRRTILQRAWPIILANSTVPLLGLADTAVIGNWGDLPQLGAIALGALIFSFLYWSFGFLRMGTTGFTAQAAGSGDQAEVRATLGRAFLIAAALGMSIIVLQWPLRVIAFGLLNGSERVEQLAAGYFSVRIFGAPAILGLYALMGTLIGLGHSKALLWTQLVLNGVNIVLDVLFAGVLGLGAQGIALGTALAEWIAVGYGAFLVLGILRRRHTDAESFWAWDRVCDRDKLLQTLSANSNILVRTLLLLFSFAWFVNQSAALGDAVLGANHILLQLVSFSAFFLDGYAFVTESLVGEALGAKRRRHLTLAVRRSTELAAITALLLAAVIMGFGEFVVRQLADFSSVHEAAAAALPWAALYVLLSFPAFQLDGVFIGATRTEQMRNASIISAAVFLLAWWWLMPVFGNDGLWWAFILYVCARAVALLIYYPGLVRATQANASRAIGE